MTPINVDNLPDDLKALRQWVVWKRETRRNKAGEIEYTKVPYQPNGYHAKSNKPRTWAAFETALEAAPCFDGIGLCFGGEVVGVDLDSCFNDDRTLKPWADDLLCDDGGLAIPTYCEVSPSGSGLHLLYFGALPLDLPRRRYNFGQHEGIELYAHPSNRFFTVTGQRWAGVTTVTRIEPVDLAPMIYYADELMPRKPQAQPARPRTAQPTRREDDDILLTIGRARNADKAVALLTGNATAYPSASEADAALCAILTYYTRDAAQIDRLYRRSGLYRDKWDEKHSADGRTYGQITIGHALELATGGGAS